MHKQLPCFSFIFTNPNLCVIEISQDKAQAIIDEITRAYEKASAGK
jgi:hypothetical protein